MVLRTARPERHPKTGVFYLRKRVPKDLVALIGRPAIRRSLGTKDVVEARKRHAEALVELEARWRNLRAEPVLLTPAELHALAVEFCDHIANRGEGRGSFFPDDVACARAFAEAHGEPSAREAFRRAFGSKIERFCDARGIRIDPACHRAFELAVARAVDASAGRRPWVMMHAGPAVGQRPPLDPVLADYAAEAPATRVPCAPVNVLRIASQFEGYSKAAKLAKSTCKRWGLALKTLEAHLRHDDLARITSDDVSEWIRMLRKEGRSDRTIRDVHLAALKALLNWLVGERRLNVNVAGGFRIKVAKSVVERSRSLSDQEASTILAASLAPPSAKLGHRHAAARRWIPWLCAYTGARVNELTQIRKEDVFFEGDIPVLRITPEAGTVKTGRFRLVPLHPHLKEQGFLRFVAASRAGPLFYEALPKGSPERATPPFKKLGERLSRWARSVGVDDPRVDPFHGWRHRFKTIGRRTRIAPDVLDAIQGHVPRTEGGNYGEFDVPTMYCEIVRVPRYELKEATNASHLIGVCGIRHKRIVTR